MKYIAYYGSWSNRTFRELQAQKYDDAVKEALVLEIASGWGLFEIPKKIDYDNFDSWLISWLQETRYWDISAIGKNVKESWENKEFKTFREAVGNYLLLRISNHTTIYEVNSVSEVADEVGVLGHKIVGDAIFEILNKKKEEKELEIYQQLKAKFEVRETK